MTEPPTTTDSSVADTIKSAAHIARDLVRTGFTSTNDVARVAVAALVLHARDLAHVVARERGGDDAVASDEDVALMVKERADSVRDTILRLHAFAAEHPLPRQPGFFKFSDSLPRDPSELVRAGHDLLSEVRPKHDRATTAVLATVLFLLGHETADAAIARTDATDEERRVLEARAAQEGADWARDAMVELNAVLERVERAT